MSDSTTPRFDTIAVHGGQSPDPTTGSRAVPIYQTAAYNFKDTDHAADLFGLRAFGNIYSRIMNPTNDVLEQRVAALEGGSAAVAVASGHAAEVLALLNVAGTGDNIVSSTSLYGGTWNIFLHTFRRLGIEVRFVETTDTDGFAPPQTTRTRAWFVETIGNPRLDVPDLGGLAAAGRELGIPLVVDNTFAYAVPVPPDRARRRGRRRVADEVARRARHLHRRHHRRRRQLRLGHRSPSVLHRARRELPRAQVLGRLRRLPGSGQRRVRDSCPRQRAARLRAGALAVQRPAVPARRRDAFASRAAPQRQRAGGRQVPRGAPEGRVGRVPGSGEPSHACKRQEAPHERLRRCRGIRREGWARGRQDAHQQRGAVQPPRERGRCEVAHHPPRLDHALPAVGRRAR